MAGNSPANEKQSCIAAGVGATLEAEECFDKLVSQALVTHDASNVGTSRVSCSIQLRRRSGSI